MNEYWACVWHLVGIPIPQCPLNRHAYTTVVDAVIISYQQNLYIYQRTVFSYQKSDINRKSIVKTWLQQFSVIFLSCLMANEQQVLQTDCSCSRARSSRLSLFYYDYNQSQSRPVALLSRVNTHHSCSQHARPQCVCVETQQGSSKGTGSAVSSSSSLSLCTRVFGWIRMSKLLVMRIILVDYLGQSVPLWLVRTNKHCYYG